MSDPAAGTPNPTVSSAFVRSALQGLDAAGRASALAQAGIAADLPEQALARVPAHSFARLWVAVAGLLDDEFFGLDARRMKVGSFALLCHALAGQRRLGTALQAALRGFGLFLDDMGASLRVGHGRAAIVLSNRLPAERADARRFADETLLVMLHGLLCWLAGRRVPLARLDWAHPRPAHADEYRRMFSPVICFDAPATAVHFDARLLQAEVRVDAASLRAFLRDAPQSVFLKQVAGAGLSERVARQCRLALAQGLPAPTFERLAAELGASPATLRRRLEAEGANWQQLKDGVRRDLALQLLADGQLTVDAVAARLGFNDASSFSRACRKWTGKAPGAWRLAAGSASGSASG